MMRDILMPEVAKAGPVLTIRKWLRSAGETILTGEVLAQVEGEQGLLELEAAVGGVLVEVVLAAGRSVAPGTVIARMNENVEGGRMKDEMKPETTMANSDAIPVLMPQAGNSMEEGTIVKWRVKEGDRITKGQVIFEVETDKATMEVEATDSGRVAKIVVGEGGVQKVKEPVAYLSEGEVACSGGASPQVAPAVTKAQESGACAPTTNAPAAVPVSSGMLKASPAAKKIATEKGLNLASVGTGSGPGGRILSTDLAKATVVGAPNAASAATTSRRKMTKMRKAIAANLALSKQTVPHFYLRATINADAMMAFYKAEKTKYPCSVNDVVTLACAKAIMEFPAFRSKLDGDEVVEYPAANIGVAVGVDDGLTVPVLINAQTMTLQQIGQNTKRIAESARAGKLEGYGQGNFTISNLGMFGVEEFAAIVNPPEPAILAVGAVREAVIVKDGAMKAGRVMTMTLSCDHRIVDGLLAAKFMARLKDLLENAETMQNAE